MGCTATSSSSYFFPKQIKWMGRGSLGQTYLYENVITKIQYIKKVLLLDDYHYDQLDNTVVFIS